MCCQLSSQKKASLGDERSFFQFQDESCVASLGGKDQEEIGGMKVPTCIALWAMVLHQIIIDEAKMKDELGVAKVDIAKKREVFEVLLLSRDCELQGL
ncbi:hypothetical protein Patl1_37316 [Pistacia atlantica]|nr:hypothetical protein Patl1_37316 [Pistacia atlantica]